MDGGVERRGGDPLVLRQQVVGVLVEIGDTADPGGAGQEVVAVRELLLQEVRVPRVRPEEVIAGMVLEAPLDDAIFREVVEADDLVAGLQELLYDIAGDEPRRPGDQDFHVGRLLGKETERKRPPAGYAPVVTGLVVGSETAGAAAGAGRRRQLQTSMTSLPSIGGSSRYTRCGVAMKSASASASTCSSGTRLGSQT